ncbi:hypothetical protein DAEQUDRAFT_718308 [Daedalea quercina L-15889]|uniref:AB hydrolase-1 domain-containing protein n=1 Tax=Daedalea quercina L-15889 TaxID=1314783 RepID=A0A165LCX1_9APHY|nr:hypothetical protein DAEQUDRAFT_718308 [Daedalea quercina L-15889]
MLALKVNDAGDELTYTDSGLPSSTSDAPYVTVFAVHGIIFNNLVFKRLQALAPAANLRIVAINRRGFGGSTPMSEHLANLLASGSDEEKRQASDILCNEVLYFVDAFIQKEGIPPISSDRQGGGFALLGWSAGCGYVTRAVSNIHSYPSEMQARLAQYIRALIIEDPPSAALGYVDPPGTWSFDAFRVPQEAQNYFFLQSLTAYYDHGDLSTRDKSVIEYITPSFSRAPTIFNMSAEERATMMETTLATDLPVLFGMVPSSQRAFHKACFDSRITALLPHMKVWHLGCDAAASYGIAAYFDILADDEAHGGGLINFRNIQGANHFVSSLRRPTS